MGTLLNLIHFFTGGNPWVPLFWALMISIVILVLPLLAAPDEKPVFIDLRRRTLYNFRTLPLPLILLGFFALPLFGFDGQFDAFGPFLLPVVTILWAPLGALLLGGKAAWQTNNKSIRKLFFGLLLAMLVLNVLASFPPVIEMIENPPPAFQPRSVRMAQASPLSQTEAKLLQSARMELTLGVENTVLGPAHTNNLINDLKNRQLFKDVAPLLDMIRQPDLIASVGDGAKFSLRLAENPDKRIKINVFYKKGGMYQWRNDRKQYLDRLAVETIKAVRELQASASAL